MSPPENPLPPAVRIGRAVGRATLLGAVLVGGWMFVTTYRDMFQAAPGGGEAGPAEDAKPLADGPLVTAGDWTFGLPGWDLAYRVTTADEWARPDATSELPVGPKTDLETKLLRTAASLGRPKAVGSATVYEGPLGGMAWARARVVRHGGEDRLVHAAAAWKTDGDRFAVLELRPARDSNRPGAIGLLPLPAGVTILATRSAADGTPQMQLVGPVADADGLAAHWSAAGWERSALETSADGAVSPVAVYRNALTRVQVMKWDGPKGLGTYFILLPAQQSE